MRLLTNRRASIDHAPGPSIASATPTAASRIRAQGSPVRENAVQTATPAIMPPAIGVHRPAQRRRARAPSITAIDDRLKLKAFPPKWKAVIAAVTRRHKSPIPAHPLDLRRPDVRKLCDRQIKNGTSPNHHQANPTPDLHTSPTDEKLS